MFQCEQRHRWAVLMPLHILDYPFVVQTYEPL